MATITSATSGLASAPSTWVGGVVPGTTFAGTRTTTGAAVALGAVSIPVASAAQVVTAGKRIKVAGDPNTYRVATGVASGSAGNIIIDSPGLLVAIPASATSVSVDMVDDKVVIAHPGTNNVNGSTLYQLNGARSAGDTNIPVDTSNGTIVAGECIQVLHQLGTDEDGQPYYDNTYYKVTTGITGSGTLVVSPGLTYAVADNVQIVNRGHVVEVDGVYCWGDDTGSSSTLANNGMPVSGTLKASRTTSSVLTVRGTCFIAGGGSIDLGATGDVIPAGVNTTVAINDSATLAIGKHALTSLNQKNPTFKMRGVKRTRNTRLTSAVLANASGITVDASENWAVGDRVVIASDTDDPNRAQIVTLSGGATPNWTVSPNVTNARAAGTRVGNLSSNVTLKASNASFAGPAAVHHSASSVSYRAIVDIGDIRAENITSSTGGWSGFSNAPAHQAFGFALAGLNTATVSRVAAEATGTATMVACVDFDGASTNAHYAKDWAIYSVNFGVYAGNVGSSVIKDCITYSSATALNQTFGAMASLLVDGGESWASQFYTLLDSSYSGVARNHKIHAVQQLARCRLGLITLENCDISASAVSLPSANFVSGGLRIKGGTLSAGTLSGNNTTTAVPQQTQYSLLSEIGGDPADNRVLGYWISATTDLTTRKRSTYAVKIQPKVANTAITYTFAIPAVSGVQQTIKGSLRFDGTYGTATPPRIDLSGQGVTQSKVCAAVADAWDDFAFTFTPTSTGDITATVTVQSASTAGFAWLDGVYHYPMTQSVRHYGYQFLAQTALIANTKLSVTNEATVLAYPVAVNHGTGTITISGDVTATQLGDYLEADLCQTANQGVAVHYTLGVGGAFTTSYNLVVNTGCTVTGEFTTSGDVTLTGTGDVDGVYTDSVGRHVKILAPNLIAGTWVYLYNVTDDALISKVQLSGAGLSLPIVYAADKTVEYRFGYSDATTRKYLIRGTGVLSSSGLQVIDSQVDDPVYAAIAGDPATFTEFAPDFPNLQVDAEETFLVPRIYKWLMWAEASSDGIELMAGAVSSDDGTNVRINVDVVDAMIQNPNAGTNIFARGGYIYRSDGTGWIVPGPGIITPDFGRAYVASGSGIAADVWAAPTRTLTGPEPLVLDNGEQLLTVNTSTGVPKYLARG